MLKHSNYHIYISLFLILFLSFGCSQKSHDKPQKEALSNLTTYIDTIEDPMRKEQMQNLILSMEKNINLFKKEQEKFISIASTMFYDYDISREELNRHHKAWITRRIQIQKDLINIHFDMREVATQEEWEHITSLQDQRFDMLKQELKDN